MSCENDQKRCVYKKRNTAQKSIQNFHWQKNSLLSATIILSCSPMAYNTTASLDKLTCTDWVDFSKCQDRFGQFSWSKTDSNYLGVKPKILKKGDNEEFRLVQNPTMREPDFNRFLQLKNQLVITAENFAREENLSPVPTLSRDMDEQLILAHKVVDIVDWADRKNCVNLLRYSVEKPERSYAQVRLLARKQEDENFQQSVYVEYKFLKIFYLLDVTNSVYDNVIAKKLFSNIL